jgi:hypothetical protein
MAMLSSPYLLRTDFFPISLWSKSQRKGTVSGPFLDYLEDKELTACRTYFDVAVIRHKIKPVNDSSLESCDVFKLGEGSPCAHRTFTATMVRSIFALGAFYATYSAFGQTPPTNLPPATPGVFSAQSSIIINGPIETVWDMLLDFPAYPDWNPFVR